MRGAFKESDVPLTAVALAGYAIGLTGYAAIKILSPAFYALDDAKTPMLIALGSIVVNFIGSYFLRDLLSHVGVSSTAPQGYGHAGVALATSLVALVNFSALFLIMRRRIDRLNGRFILISFLKIAVASAALSLVCYFSYHYLFGVYGASTLVLRLVEAFVPMALGGIAFVIAAKLLRVSELEKLAGSLRRKFAR